METKAEIIARILGKKQKSKRSVGGKTSGSDRHVWTIAEERLVIDLYRRRASKEEIRETIEGTELKLASVLMKIENIRYLDTGEGLERVSGLTRRLWEEVA